MTLLALMFLVLSWSCVLGLTAWAFYRVLRADVRRRLAPAERGGDPGGNADSATRPDHGRGRE